MLLEPLHLTMAARRQRSQTWRLQQAAQGLVLKHPQRRLAAWCQQRQQMRLHRAAQRVRSGR